MNNDMHHTEAAIKRFSDGDSAGRWNDLYDTETERLEEANFRRRRDVAVDIALRELAPGGRAVDIACGAAPVLSELRRRGAACIGVDHAPDMLRHAQKRLRSAGLDESGLYRADCRALPFADGAFDVAVCLGLISYVEHYDAVLREIRRVLRPGGQVLISFRNCFNPVLWDPVRLLATVAVYSTGRSRPEPYRIGRLMDHREVYARMAAQGFELREHHGIGYGPLRFNGRPILSEPTSMQLDRALSSRLTGWSARWLTDVSLWLFRR